MAIDRTAAAAGAFAIGWEVVRPGDKRDNALLAGGIAALVVFTLSSFVGRHTINDCKAAQESWTVATAAAPTSGFYCLAIEGSATADLCSRDIESCLDARDAARASGKQVAERCQLVETAWCYADGRCAATPERCEALRIAAGNGNACSRTRR